MSCFWFEFVDRAFLPTGCATRMLSEARFPGRFVPLLADRVAASRPVGVDAGDAEPALKTALTRLLKIEMARMQVALECFYPHRFAAQSLSHWWKGGTSSLVPALRKKLRYALLCCVAGQGPKKVKGPFVAKTWSRFLQRGVLEASSWLDDVRRESLTLVKKSMKVSGGEEMLVVGLLERWLEASGSRCLLDLDEVGDDMRRELLEDAERIAPWIHELLEVAGGKFKPHELDPDANGRPHRSTLTRGYSRLARRETNEALVIVSLDEVRNKLFTMTPMHCDKDGPMPRSKWRSFIFACLDNKLREKRKVRKNAPPVALDQVERFEGDTVDPDDGSTREEKAILRSALEQLLPSDRKVILMRNFEDLKFAQIGKRLSIDAEAARMRHRRALDRLKSLLEPTLRDRT